jgi:hypothetical protein
MTTYRPSTSRLPAKDGGLDGILCRTSKSGGLDILTPPYLLLDHPKRLSSGVGIEQQMEVSGGITHLLLLMKKIL